MKHRLSEKAMAEGRAYIGAQEAHVRRLETIQRARNSEAVELMIACVKKAIEHAEKQLSQLAQTPLNEKDDLSQLRLIGGRLQAYHQVLADFDDPAPQIERARQAIAKTRNEMEKAAEGALVES